MTYDTTSTKQATDTVSVTTPTPTIYTIDVARLLDMLRLTRKHGSLGEVEFVNAYILPLDARIVTDKAGEDIAYVVEILGKDDKLPPVLFSAHVDTVHAHDAPMVQPIVYDEESGYVYKDDGMPLGADNAAGCAVLMHMIENRVPGAYIFHRGEEAGGIGSDAMAREQAAWLGQFKWAIAFDRKGSDSVITEMMVGDTASDEFAQALSARLNNGTRFDYRPDDTGSFTDTANYAHIIPECTNVSVGYAFEHTKEEILDMWHVDALAVRLVEIFKHGFELPVVREPHEPRSFSFGGAYGGYSWKDYDVAGGAADPAFVPTSAQEVIGMGFKNIVQYVRDNGAYEVAELIYALADRIEELEEYREEDAMRVDFELDDSSDDDDNDEE